MNINKHVLRNAHLPLAIVIVIQLSVVYTIKLTVKSCHFTTKCKGLGSYDLMALYNMIINKVICLKRQILLWLGDIQKSYSKNKKVDVFWTQGILTPSSIGCQFSLSSLSRLWTLKLVSSFLSVLSMFSCYLPLLVFYKFLTLMFFSVLAFSMQLPKLFGTPCLTQSVRPIYLFFFSSILSMFFKQLSTLPSCRL